MKATRPPDFFIVGHPKTGTTALWHALCRHPQIFLPELKEPMFLAPDIVHCGLSEQDYFSLFRPARSDQLAGEASIWYLSSREAARLIFEMNPEAKIIALFREPVDFLHSLHLQLRASHVEPEPDFQKALELEATRRASPQYLEGYPRTNDNEIRKLIYSDHVHYVEQLRRYHALFPEQNVMVIIYDDFKRDNPGVVRSVLRFLGVDDTVSVQVTNPNPSRRVRSLPVHKTVRQVQMGRGVAGNLMKPVVKALTPPAVRKRMISASDRLLMGQPETIDPALRQALKVRFAPEVHALSAYLGRDLTGLWNYDGIAEGRRVMAGHPS